jgi:monoamine oxidase
MARTPLFDRLTRALRVARFCDDHKISTTQGLERVAAHEELAQHARLRRREFLVGAGAVAATAAMQPLHRAFALGDPDVGIVGAGIAGLACADALARKGVGSVVYDALETRVGGRCFSLEGFFPGQVAERGGEFIDNLHKTMLSYAQEFDLPREDCNKRPGEIVYFFGGQLHDEAALVEEFREFTAALRMDVQQSSGAPTADSHNDVDVALDHISLLEYLESRGAGPILKAWVSVGYGAEYGLDISEQSCLNFVLFIHADRRSKFAPWGVSSDERWHLIEGNQQIPEHLAARLGPAALKRGAELVRVRKDSAGGYELTFERGRSTYTRAHRSVVLAIPFSVLRHIELDDNLELPDWKLLAIDELGYGTNSKMMVGFNGPFWIGLGSNGAGYSDQADHQTHWETNWTRATSRHAVLTDYSHGTRGATLGEHTQQEVTRWLSDLEHLYPGALAFATQVKGRYLAHVEAWPRNPLSRGSYTCYRPGQFTSIAGNEGKRVGHLHFAGEHTDSFYSWQGFMEGAALSGLRAASAILGDIKAGAL